MMRQAGFGPQVIVGTSGSRDHTSQVARATDGLREMLLRGAIRPGRRIPEIPLSVKLGVSRTPLRLAFEKLEQEGLVKPLPRSGFAASEFSITDVWEAIETRGVLEGAAARFAAERLKSAAQLETLHKVNRAMLEVTRAGLENFAQFLDLNETFHLAIVELANNKVLQRMIEQVYKFPFTSPSSRVLGAKALPEAKEMIPIAQEHHRALIDAIEHREGARAEGIAREHARLTRRHIDAALEDWSFLETLPGARMIKARRVDQK